MNVLITAGGTQEPIDGVRFLSNVSTGSTGLALARALSDRGWNVTLLHAWNLDVDGISMNTRPFRTFGDLHCALKESLENENFDVVIQLAAVGDYHLASIEVDGQSVPADGSGKIGSGHDVTMKLRPNPKLVDSLRQWSRNPGIRVVAFKLTNDTDPVMRIDAINELLERGVADIVVHNDLGEIQGDRHPASLFTPNGLLGMTGTKSELAAALFRFLSEEKTP